MPLLEARAALPASLLHMTTGCLASRPAAMELAAPLHRVTPLANLLPLQQPPLHPDIQQYVHLPTRSPALSTYLRQTPVLLCT